MKEQDRIPLQLFFMASPVPQHLDIAGPKVSLRCLLMSDSERNKARVNALLKYIGKPSLQCFE